MGDQRVFTLIGYDDFSRALYHSQKTGAVYVEVDGELFSRTPDYEEPCTSIGRLTDVTISTAAGAA
ncbi:MAG: hypothetical protein IPO08_22715 [Xanthomonadales bacterium]|nr:hypothetical protein [Xanthomonadales bacterium]